MGRVPQLPVARDWRLRRLVANGQRPANVETGARCGRALNRLVRLRDLAVHSWELGLIPVLSIHGDICEHQAPYATDDDRG